MKKVRIRHAASESAAVTIGSARVSSPGGTSEYARCSRHASLGTLARAESEALGSVGFAGCAGWW